MRVAKQLSVMLPNKPGQLAALCRKLAAAKVNIRAVSVNETTEQGIVRLVVDKPGVAQKLVKDAKLGLVLTEVILVEMVNKPGVLGKVAARLAKAKVNVEYVYGSTGPGARDAVAVFGVDNLSKAKKLV